MSKLPFKIKVISCMFSPIPGDSAHVHEGTMSYFIDWKKIFNQ